MKLFRVVLLLIGISFVLSACESTCLKCNAQEIDKEYLIKTIIMAESSGNPKAVGDNGKARGLMQIQKGTWLRFSNGASWDKAFNERENRATGERIVNHIISTYKSKGQQVTIGKILFTYNSGIFIKHSLPKKWSIEHPNKVYRQAYLMDMKNNIIG